MIYEVGHKVVLANVVETLFNTSLDHFMVITFNLYTKKKWYKVLFHFKSWVFLKLTIIL